MKGPGMLLFILAGCLLPCWGSQPSVEDYHTYTLLETALCSDSYNLYTLAEKFYPKIGSTPICQPVSYRLTCEVEASCQDCINCTAPGGYQASFLWTLYNVDQPIGPLLLSYANNGIAVKGFEWENACLFLDDIMLNLSLTNQTQGLRESSVLDALKEMTAVLKGYAKSQGKPSLGDSNTKGYAISWSEEDQERRVYHVSNLILTAIIVVLNVFVLFLSIGMTNYSYDILYRNITRKEPPGYHPAGYPIFWSIVFLTVCWNVAPSWLVLANYGFRIYWSMGFMAPLELVVAVTVKKKPNFPIPCLKACRSHHSYHYTWDPSVLRCCHCLVNHLVQALALWTILVFLTFVVYYFSAIIIVFFLYPVQTLVKVVFLKAVAVCVVINIALVISVSRFHFRCTSRACEHNLKSLFTVISALTFLPLLSYVSLVIGMILFTNSSQSSNLQSILTLIPSIFVVVAAWFSHGRLFPNGITSTDAVDEIVHDLEGGGAKGKGGGATDPPPSSLNAHPQSPPTSRSSYNSFDSRTPLEMPATGADDAETLPLVQSHSP